jgi:hypothetical protein
MRGQKDDPRARLFVRLHLTSGPRVTPAKVPFHAGALVKSAAAEALTSALIFMNKAYSVDGVGIRITGTFDDD